MGESGMLNKKLVNIAIAKRKLDLFMKDEPDSEIMQMLCILEQAVRDTIEPGHERQPKGSELTSYRQAAKILDIVLCDQPLEMLDGEIVSKATSDVAKQNAKLFGANNVSKFGRRIDLIVSSNPVDRVELSTNEWKRSTATHKVLSRQRSKNARSNKAILKNLMSLPFQERHKDKVFTMAMDWNGPVGCMFVVAPYDNIFYTEEIASLAIPVYMDDLETFLPTLDAIYMWKNHHVGLKNIVLPAVARQSRASCPTQSSTSMNVSPNVFFNPAHSRFFSSTTAIPTSPTRCTIHPLPAHPILPSDTEDVVEDEPTPLS
ncbi:hypothetical protein DM01DRAFT_43573 [Hesseltinella vesiculosa]|uniref:Uncharacterized protein n=1 Tax=Hesseltinella vesiculosa TaxID=101127 RepID=A0A1X2GGP3_9FUNG|nr:hypothetical protein DM01DRAFT_43573 [Hesseltinella vesiculosa]